MASLPVTAIFDIGKTNKKFLLFDGSFSVVYKRTINIGETEDEDGFPCDDLKKISDWIFDEFGKVANSKKYEVQALNFSTYGATVVHINHKGEPVTPLYNYLKPFPADISDEFYDKAGGREAFALETASPPMGMLNSGLQLYRIKKEKPVQFQQIKKTLHFPQYLSFLFTGRYAADHTSIGCHTAMWHFQKRAYHSWLKEEGILDLLPPVSPVQTKKAISFKGKKVQAGIGIHDSSAALAPYLFAFDEPFIQLSTGTWSIAMNPYTDDPLTFEELERDCLQYLNIFGNPVKASRFFLGGEYAYQLRKLGLVFNRNPEKMDCSPDVKMLQRLVNEPDPQKKLILEKAHTSGPYPREAAEEWDARRFGSYEEAVHQCLLDLASIQVDALKLAEGSGDVNQIIITGGFVRNKFFCRLMASLLPEKNIYTASAAEASALGAAIVLNEEALTRKELKDLIGLNIQTPFEGADIDEYSWLV